MACLFPWYKKDDPSTPLPCGGCPKCLVKITNDWVFRVGQEISDVSTSDVSFITLTYDDYSLPLTECGAMTLRRDDVQRFMKNLRRLHSTKKYLNSERGFNRAPIKVFGCGEYGTQFKRPHYHLILINADPELIADAWMARKDSSEAGFMLGAVWRSTEAFTPSAIAYVCGYMMKRRSVGKFDARGRYKEFRFMSMGLGKQYLTDDTIAYHLADLSRAYITLPGGVKSSMPRYYRDRIFSEADKAVQQLLLEASNVEQSNLKLHEFARDMDAAVVDEMVVMEYNRFTNASRKAACDLFYGRAKKRGE